MAETKKINFRDCLYVIILGIALVLVAYIFLSRGRFHCTQTGYLPVQQIEHEDGTYRGIFADGDQIQVNVQFTLQDGMVTAARFRHLRRDDNYNIDAEEEPYKSVVAMYSESLEYLVEKNLQEHLPTLYTPEQVVTTEIDGYTSATIRSSKIISAIRDGLNRGVYRY